MMIKMIKMIKMTTGQQVERAAQQVYSMTDDREQIWHGDAGSWVVRRASCVVRAVTAVGGVDELCDTVQVCIIYRVYSIV